MCRFECRLRPFELLRLSTPSEQQRKNPPSWHPRLHTSFGSFDVTADQRRKVMRHDPSHFTSAIQSIRKFSERLSVSSQALPLIETFEVTFDNADSVYYAGEKVTGCVTLQLNDEQKISEVLLELKGGAKTYWTKHSGKSRKHYRDSEPYFCEQFNTNYTHSYGNTKDRSLPRGRHDIPFTYQLPDNLPSSFEGDYGYVRYVCKATLERPWDFDIVCKRAFTVIGVQKADYSENLLKPALLFDSNSKLNFCFLTNSVVSAHLKLAETVLVLGSRAAVSVRVVNENKRSLHSSRLVIRQRTRYKAKDFSGNEHYKNSVKEVATLAVPFKNDGANDDQETDWQQEHIAIPSVPPLFKCKIIDIGYQLCYEVDQIISLSAPIILAALGRDKKVPDERIKKRVPVHGRQRDAERTPMVRNVTGGLRSHIKPEQFRDKRLVCRPCVLGGNDINDSNESVHYGSSQFVPSYPCVEDNVGKEPVSSTVPEEADE